jgi:hypothetical protein
MEDDRQASEGDGGPVDDQDTDGATASGPAQPPGDYGDVLLALERQRDPQGNENTRPPASEAITLRSMTVVEMYAGQAIESLTMALAAIKWTGLDPSIVDQIAEAEKSYTYSQGVFYLTDTGSGDIGGVIGRGRTRLPTAISRIYGNYYVLGPSLVAVVLTFVLAEEEAKRIDAALRNDAESHVDQPTAATFRRKSVRDVKKELVRHIRDDVSQRCRQWIQDTMPGTLSAVHEGPGIPVCALLSLSEGLPFETHAEYMALLDLVNDFLAERFVAPNFLYLAYPIDIGQNQRMTGAFNENKALGEHWVHDLSAAPEVFHQAVSSLMIADGIYAVLLSYEPKLRDVRAALNRLDFSAATGAEVIGLRNRLLTISRDVSTICSDVTVLVDDAFAIWSDIPPLVRLQASGSDGNPEETRDAKRRQLRAVVASLQSQEANLRELILVTSASTSETRSLELQTKVFDLTRKLNGLTIGLIILTIVLVILGVAALLVALFHVPAVHVQLPSSHAAFGLRLRHASRETRRAVYSASSA